MPYKLQISKEEVKAELENRGYPHVDDGTVEVFRKDLLRLIKEDLKKFRALKVEQTSPQAPGSSQVSYSTEEREKTTEYQKRYKLDISNEEVRAELKRQGHDDVDDQTVERFKRELLRQIKEDVKKYKTQKAEGTSLKSSQIGNEEKDLSTNKNLNQYNILEGKEKVNPTVKTKSKKIDPKEDPSYPVRPDPVNLYHYYKHFWDKYKLPGEDPRKDLRWDIRTKLFHS